MEGPFDYNHGFVNPSSNWPMPGIDSLDAAKQWRTVMAYNDACDDEGEFCRRIRNWSDPDSTLLGEPMGIASGNSAADNVRALNNTASTVAAFSDALPSVFGFITDVQAGAPLEGAEVVASDGRSVTTDENGFLRISRFRGGTIWILNQNCRDIFFNLSRTVQRILQTMFK